MVIEVRDSQSQKAALPIYLTLGGILIEARDLHNWKAFSPISLILCGMVTEAKFEQPKKAPSPMLVTPSGIVTWTRFVTIAQLESRVLVHIALPTVNPFVYIDDSVRLIPKPLSFFEGIFVEICKIG